MGSEISTTTLPVLGELPCTWRVDDFASVLDGGSRNGVYKPKEFHGRGVKIVNMGELFAHPRLFAVHMKRVELTEREKEKSLLREGDLLFARRSLVAEGAGQCSVVCEVDEPTTFESSIIRARPDPTKADSLFLYYVFRSPYGQYILDTIRRQVAVAGITGSDLVRLPVPLPPLPEQKTTARILGALDDKIELNRRMNETLEATARAIFKSWFVDFLPVRAKQRARTQTGDPVRAKAEGRAPEGLDPATAALFPDSFEDSPLGEIPAGWRVDELQEHLGVIETGRRPRGGVKGIANGIPSVGAESIGGIGVFDFGKTKFVSEEYFLSMKRGQVAHLDVLLYKDGRRPGEFEPHVGMFGEGFPFERFCINEHVYRLRARRPATQAYLYFWLTTDAMMDEMRNRGTGVAVPGLNSANVKAMPFLVPPTALLTSFEDKAKPVVTRILGNATESRTLAAIRDALLPKLLSGELRVKDVESGVGGIG